MAKLRVYEAAKEMGISTQEMFAILKELGIEKNNPFHTIEEEEYQVIKELFAAQPQPKLKPKPKAEAEAEAEAKVKEAPEPKTKAKVEEKPAEEPKPRPAKPEEREKPKAGVPRPPIVAVLGHVDHGKTTLLDYIRKTRVAQREVGGITQSIGAYQVEYDGKKITFIDTPGHRAFTQMRLRGAQATDIVILVVAADDGVMAQTKEAIAHARAANVPIIVAINKIDKREANPDRVKEQLAKEGLVPEEWGGETVMVPISALTGENVDDLLEMILLVAEMADLRADPAKKAEGIIIESYLDPAKGPVATVIIRDGTLRAQDIVVAGTAYGRIRSLLDEHGRPMKEAPPGSAAQILGLSEVPPAGVKLEVLKSLNEARELAERRKEEERQRRLERSRLSPMELFQQQLRKARTRTLKLILKAETVGALEALQAELRRIKVEGIEQEVIHAGVGNVSENDVLLASSAEGSALIIAFGVEVDKKAAELAQAEGVAIKQSEIIYELTEAIERLLQSAVAPKFEEVRLGLAEVKQVFNIPRVGVVAGCYVREGVVSRKAHVRVLRNGTEVFRGPIRSLRRYDRDVEQVEQGRECGLRIENWSDVQVGDLLEVFILRKVEPGLTPPVRSGSR